MEKNCFFFWPGKLMYVGTAMDTDVHQHHAIQLIMTFNKPFTMKTNTKELKVMDVIIDSNQPHNCHVSENTRFILLNIDPLSGIGKILKQKFLFNSGILELHRDKTKKFINKLKLVMKSKEFTSEEVTKITFQFLAELGGNALSSKIDSRLEMILPVIRNRAFENPGIKELSEICHLSSGRLIHLFTKEVGIPIRRYVLWIRVMSAIQKAFESHNLQEAAIDSGFSDAPHFNRTFKKMFGLAPTDILKNSQIVQGYWNNNI
jgi:AraC-like DNA-binding protein